MLLPDIDDALLHPANASEAKAIQEHLRGQICIKDDFGPITTLAGIDVGYDIKNNESRASIVVLDKETLHPIETVQAYLPTTFPYIPGLLSFREIPVVIEALKALQHTPDMIFIDGQGIAHPRRLGIATHLGLLIDKPTIGVAKARLCGRYDEPGLQKGDYTPLKDGQEQIGTVLRSRDKVKPLFISPGHKVGYETALKLVMDSLTRYRLPEATRLADKLSKYPKKQQQKLL
jgi:deoxyribonuclease V